ncbi:glycolate oxidase subunit GlcE [Xylophilus ampelinus]|uniref:Glycolate oxidase FAD binding subunit n=1 Tax=Xylophilus ampelinus TaxID=54067 RepID=A0A318SLM7_9BURK|nr:glycolate oxidase subunit GlcE [Xylophilus ampelinus]MCS4510604.1 glycolate oxidase subunit GlcE [Xylophilus ampelinus]PYE77769.1 glycolate oxidase FAD binding subunit [Xylophilus ampelinus]
MVSACPTLDRMVDRIRAAAAHGTPLRLSGGGTKDFYGGAVDGEILDTHALSGITSYEPSELFVTVRAGTSLAELEATLAEKGQCLPFEPPHFAAGGTVGGMVAAGLAGPARANLGSVRDYVLGATLVNGRGEVLTFGGQVMKNVAGYDVSRVLAGSMGTLGLIAEVSLKVLPTMPAETTLRFGCSQTEALALLHGWGGRPLPLNASAWTQEYGGGVLYLRLRGAVAAVEAACTQLGGERVTAASDIWNALRHQRLAWFDGGAEPSDLWRLSVAQTAPALGLDPTPLVEWHGGQRWYRAAPGTAARMRAVARAAGGHATLFRASAVSAHSPRFDAVSPVLERIQRALQREFDPAGIFNRPARSAPAGSWPERAPDDGTATR